MLGEVPGCCEVGQGSEMLPWQVMVGLVLRDHLMVVLRRCLAAGGTAAMANEPVPYEELSRHVVTAAARSYVSEQQMAVLQVLPSSSRPCRVRSCLPCYFMAGQHSAAAGEVVRAMGKTSTQTRLLIPQTHL